MTPFLIALALWWQVPVSPTSQPSVQQQPVLNFAITPQEQFFAGADFTAVVGTHPFQLISVTSVNMKTGANSTSAVIAVSPIPGIVGGTDIVAFMVMATLPNDQQHISVLVQDQVTGSKFLGQLNMLVKQWP